jgi:recombination protein RecA
MAKAKETFNLKTLADIGEIEFITTGIDEIDEIVKFPKARITEIFGMQGIGKTDLILNCLSKISLEGKVLYIDVENALNPTRLKEKGGNLKNIDISDESILQDVANFVNKSVKKYDCIVIDSVAALVSREEANGETGDQFVGLKARLMGQWMRQLVPVLGKSNCAVVFINQLRDSMIMYGDPQFTPGGKALPYAASLRIKLSTTKADRLPGKTGEPARGHKVTFEIVKSRVCAPHQKGQFKLMY